tara:strand:- start:49 stop:411 length:363 start_codon:yes stop_codon:yes gene_type:complete
VVVSSNVNDPDVLERVASQLRAGKFEFLELQPFMNIACQHVSLGVFNAPMSIPAEDARKTDDLCVIDSWVVTYDGHTSFYNQECWPTAFDAVQQHVGRLAIEGHLPLVKYPYESDNAPED